MSELTVASLGALGQEYQTIAHNLANASTVGFKRRIGVFTQDDRPVGAGAVGAAARGRAALRAENYVDFTQGALVQTGRSLDVALDGAGFLVVETDGGERYTRNGVLHLNGQGRLVDALGRPIAGEGGPITVPPTVSPEGLQVAEDGRVLAAGTEIGKLRVVEFEDPKVLQVVGESLFAAPDRVRAGPAAATTVHQGFQEASNVSTVHELVALIKVSRLYEANARIIDEQRERGRDLLRVAMA